MKITVLGPGAWGTAIAKLYALNGNDVVMYGNEERFLSINDTHINDVFYPDVVLPSNISVTTDLGNALQNADTIVFAVPSKVYRTVARQVNGLLDHKVHIVSTGKGFDPSTLDRLSSVLRNEISPSNRYDIVSLIGPSYANEVIRDKITLITAVSLDINEAKYIQDTLSNPRFRIYTNTDEIGAECSAALKNVIAIAAGTSAGLGEGDNAKAAIVTRGIAEIERFAVAMGGKKETFLGLSGIGDLMLTCNSMQSRNYSLGYEIGRLNDGEAALKKNTKTVEGVGTSQNVLHLAERLGIEMPITQAVKEVLFDKAKPSVKVGELMTRALKSE